MHQRSLKTFPKSPKSIITTFVPAYDGLNFWSAYQAERGVKLVGVQYGGGYGSILCSPPEKHEMSIFDNYLSWGWTDEKQPKITPMASGKIPGVRRKIRPEPKGGILWVGMSMTRYAYWMCNITRMPDFIKDQERFVCDVLPEVRELMSMRCDPREFWLE